MPSRIPTSRRRLPGKPPLGASVADQPIFIKGHYEQKILATKARLEKIRQDTRELSAIRKIKRRPKIKILSDIVVVPARKPPQPAGKPPQPVRKQPQPATPQTTPTPTDETDLANEVARYGVRQNLWPPWLNAALTKLRPKGFPTHKRLRKRLVTITGQLLYINVPLKCFVFFPVVCVRVSVFLASRYKN